jgi:[ribosomal protein S18]-alanine N-acetyltransferase
MYYCRILVFTIRQIQSDDLFQVIDLASQVLTEKYTPQLFLYFYESFPWGFWVAEKNKQIIGFIVGIRTSQRKGRVLMLGVHETHRNLGIGSKILNQFLKEAIKRKIIQIELEVQATNEQAIRFYKHHSFSVVDRMEKFYQNGDDALIMRWGQVSQG